MIADSHSPKDRPQVVEEHWSHLAVAEAVSAGRRSPAPVFAENAERPVAVSLPNSEKVRKYRVLAADTAALLSLLSRVKAHAERRCRQAGRG